VVFPKDISVADDFSRLKDTALIDDTRCGFRGVHLRGDPEQGRS